MDKQQSAVPMVASNLHANSKTAKTGLIWLMLVAALVVGSVVGFVVARYVVKDQANQRYSDLKTQFDVTVAQNQYDLSKALTRLDALQGQMLVEQSTRKSLEASLLSTQNELGHARDQLAFYNQLIPPGPSGSISIRALDVEQHGATLQYRVLFMRNAVGETFNGLMEFVANGHLKGKQVKIKLAPAQAAASTVNASSNTDASLLALSFDQFQRSEGVLSLPDGFIPKTITVNVLDGKTVRVSRTVNLPHPN